MSTPAGADRAPEAPGRMGEAVGPEEVRHYLDELGSWLHGRRSELDELDGHALAVGRGDEVAGDMSLALALWKAIHDRFQLISSTFDDGRVLTGDRERIAALIWGRLDGATLDMPGGMAVSLPEACRLDDALTAQLRSQLALESGSARVTARIRGLRAQLARIEDQIALEPDTTRDRAVHHLAGLVDRLQQLDARAQQGADVGGLLGPLELDATSTERDLIVGHARRRHTRDRVLAARELRDDLAQRAVALARLAERCVATVDPAPRYAVPDVAALGPVPVTADEVEPYLRQLDRVSAALEWAQDRYAAALAEREGLVEELDALVDRARRAGLVHLDDLAGAEGAAREVLDRRPTPVEVTRQLVATYRAWLEHHGEEP